MVAALEGTHEGAAFGSVGSPFARGGVVVVPEGYCGLQLGFITDGPVDDSSGDREDGGGANDGGAEPHGAGWVVLEADGREGKEVTTLQLCLQGESSTHNDHARTDPSEREQMRVSVNDHWLRP